MPLVWTCITFKTIKDKLFLGIFYLIISSIGYSTFVTLLVLFSDNVSVGDNNDFTYLKFMKNVVITQIIVISITWPFLLAAGILITAGKKTKPIMVIDLVTNKPIINYQKQELGYLSKGKSWLIAACVLGTIFTFGIGLLWWVPITLMTTTRAWKLQKTANLGIIIALLSVISLVIIFIPVGIMAAVYYAMFEPDNLDKEIKNFEE
ncbi:hypothetical protein [Spiroplasma chrysopicola]|uniref:hypothetical protein n=1 Tax=Spiroplasma chrysopicola TaxID=216933 RepID=UPI0011818354|nr:hypothetical protein [Spiroplasma chrysopicola]